MRDLHAWSLSLDSSLSIASFIREPSCLQLRFLGSNCRKILEASGAPLRLMPRGIDVEKGIRGSLGASASSAKKPRNWKLDSRPRGDRRQTPVRPRRLRAATHLRCLSPKRPRHRRPTFRRSPPRPTTLRQSRRRSMTRLRSAAVCGFPFCSCCSI